MGWGAQDDDDSIAAIHRAVESGITWIDTAPVYGYGRAEQVVGRALAQLPAADRPLVFTKCGLVWDEGGEHENLTPESIRRECDDSLRRLGLDHIDLYQIHVPDPAGPPIEESWQALLDLVEAGKVRHAGVSNFGPDLLSRCEAVGHVTSLQPPLSLINRDVLAAAVPWCDRNGAGVLVYSPIQAGLLSGRFSAARAAALTDDDWRSRDAEFHGRKLASNLALADALRPVAERHGVSAAAIAVAWTIAQTGVSAAIVGARSADQIDDWIAAGSLELDKDDLAELRAALLETQAGHGPLPS
jgi:aryl-alcohol dehydrogenase-like predicted oxidoreductase